MPETDPQPLPIRPLSRRASRVFVILCLLAIIGTAAVATWMLSRTAMEHQEQIEANTGGADSSAVRGFGVTEY